MPASPYHSVIKQKDDWWIGWVEEVPGMNCQEKTREQLIEILQACLNEAIELSRESE